MKHKILLFLLFCASLPTLQAQRSTRIQDLLLKYEQLWDTLTNETIPYAQRRSYKAPFEALFEKPDSILIFSDINNSTFRSEIRVADYTSALLSDMENSDLTLSYFYYQRMNPGRVDKHYRVYVHKTIRYPNSSIIKHALVFLLNANADKIIGIQPYDDFDMDGVADDDDFCPEIPGIVENGCPKPGFFESLGKPIKDDGKTAGIYLEYERYFIAPNDTNRIFTSIMEGLMSDPVNLPIYIETDQPEILHSVSFGAQLQQLNPPDKVGLVLNARVGLSFYFNSLFRLSSGDLFGGLGFGARRFYWLFNPIGLKYISGRIMPAEAGRIAATTDGPLTGSEILVHKLLYMPNVEMGYRLNHHHSLSVSFTFLSNLTSRNEHWFAGGRYFYNF